MSLQYSLLTDIYAGSAHGMFVDGFPGPDIVRDSIQGLPQGFKIVTF